MARSKKTRHGLKCQCDKHGVRASRIQAHGWSKRKKINRRKQRRKEKKVAAE